MSDIHFEDRRAAQLLTRVREDLSSLSHDVKTLLGHATRHTLPDGAKHLASRSGERLSVGRELASVKMRRLGDAARDHATGVSIGGLLLLGATAAGVYLAMKGGCGGARSGPEPEPVSEPEP